MTQKQLLANCRECMLSRRIGNAIFTKLLQNFETGIDYTDQPFNIKYLVYGAISCQILGATCRKVGALRVKSGLSVI